MKTDSEYATFYRTRAGHRESIRATIPQLKEELSKRETEFLSLSNCCTMCGRLTDGRTIFDDKPICPPCYFALIKWAGMPVPFTGPILSPGASITNEIKNLAEVAKPFSVDPFKKEETREDTAARLGIPLELLEETGYFDKK